MAILKAQRPSSRAGREADRRVQRLVGRRRSAQVTEAETKAMECAIGWLGALHREGKGGGMLPVAMNVIERLRDDRVMVAYFRCDAHKDIPFTMTATCTARTAIRVCPICNPPDSTPNAQAQPRAREASTSAGAPG